LIKISHHERVISKRNGRVELALPFLSKRYPMLAFYSQSSALKVASIDEVKFSTCRDKIKK